MNTHSQSGMKQRIPCHRLVEQLRLRKAGIHLVTEVSLVRPILSAPTVTKGQIASFHQSESHRKWSAVHGVISVSQPSLKPSSQLGLAMRTISYLKTSSKISGASVIQVSQVSFQSIEKNPYTLIRCNIQLGLSYIAKCLQLGTSTLVVMCISEP